MGFRREYFFEKWLLGNAVHTVCTHCEVLDVGTYLDPNLARFDKFLVPYWIFFLLRMHLGFGTFELSPFVADFEPFPPIFHPPY